MVICLSERGKEFGWMASRSFRKTVTPQSFYFLAV
jgi:hypothetical protein